MDSRGVYPSHIAYIMCIHTSKLMFAVCASLCNKFVSQGLFHTLSTFQRSIFTLFTPYPRLGLPHARQLSKSSEGSSPRSHRASAHAFWMARLVFSDFFIPYTIIIAHCTRTTKPQARSPLHKPEKDTRYLLHITAMRSTRQTCALHARLCLANSTNSLICCSAKSRDLPYLSMDDHSLHTCLKK
jgi:hypothetical protein